MINKRVYKQLLTETIVPEMLTREDKVKAYYQLESYVNDNIPPKLYRYRRCNEYSIDAFYKDELWFSNGTSMNFKTFQLIVGSRFLNEDDFQRIILFSKKYQYKNDIHSIKTEILDERFLWLYSQYEDCALYGETVINIDNNAEYKNTRKRNEVELRKQLFALYDKKNKYLYLQDISKKAFLKSYLTAALCEEVYIKNLYTSIDEFQKAIASVNSIRFVQHDQIVNRYGENSIFNKTMNMLGLDFPNKLISKIELNPTPVGKLKNALNKINLMKDEGYLQEVVIVGTDDNGIEHMFDYKALIQQITIEVKKDNNHRYDDMVVLEKLLEEVKNV